MMRPLMASSKLENPVQRTASVFGLRGAAPPAETSVVAWHAGSRGSAAKATLASMASLGSERGSLNGRVEPAPDQAATASTAIDVDTSLFMTLPQCEPIRCNAAPIKRLTVDLKNIIMPSVAHRMPAAGEQG